MEESKVKAIPAFGDRSDKEVVWLERELNKAGITLDWAPKEDSIPAISLVFMTAKRLPRWPTSLARAILLPNKVVIQCLLPGGLPVNIDSTEINFIKDRQEALDSLVFSLQVWIKDP